MTGQFSIMERNAFHISYLSDKIPEAVFHGQAVRTVAYLRVSTTQQGLSKTAIAKLTGVSRTALYSFMRTWGGSSRALSVYFWTNLVSTLLSSMTVRPGSSCSILDLSAICRSRPNPYAVRVPPHPKSQHRSISVLVQIGLSER